MYWIILEKIRGIAFSWHGLYASQSRPDDRKEIGLIAQDVEAVFPELLTTWADEDSKVVEYGRFSAVLLGAVKELKANVDALTIKIALLESLTVETDRRHPQTGAHWRSRLLHPRLN